MKDSTRSLDKVIRIDEGKIEGHLNRVVRGTVEETLNTLLDEEANRLVNAERYERSDGRRGYRSGSYTQQAAYPSR